MPCSVEFKDTYEGLTLRLSDREHKQQDRRVRFVSIKETKQGEPIPTNTAAKENNQ
jgi:hypothetical protein